MLNLQPEFERTLNSSGKPELANEVIRLRESFYKKRGGEAVDQKATEAIINTVGSVTQVFRLPLAANLIALMPRDPTETALLEIFLDPMFSGE